MIWCPQLVVKKDRNYSTNLHRYIFIIHVIINIMILSKTVDRNAVLSKDEITALIKESTSELINRINILEEENKDLKKEIRNIKNTFDNNYIQTITIHCLMHSMHRNTCEFLYNHRTVWLSSIMQMRDFYLDALRAKYKDSNLQYNKHLGYGFHLPIHQLYNYSIKIVDSNNNEVIFDGQNQEIKVLFKEACNSGDWSKYPYECLKKLVKTVPHIMFDLYVPDTISGKYGMRIDDYVETL